MSAALSFDFIVQRRRPWHGMVLLLLAGLLLTAVAIRWSAGNQENLALAATIGQQEALLQQQRLAVLAAQRRPDPQEVQRRQGEERIAAQLDYPWNRLLGEIEEGATKDVAVLALTHDQANASTELAVEARAVPHVLAMLERLNDDDAPRWYLGSYQAQPQSNPPVIRAQLVNKPRK